MDDETKTLLSPVELGREEEACAREDERLREDARRLEDERLLTRLSGWLTQTRADAAALLDSQGRMEDGLAGQTLRGEMQVAAATASHDLGQEPDFDSLGPGLFKLVEEFTALRQDVKLQAKSARGLQDQVDGLLTGLNRAIEQFQSVPAREEDAVHEALRPVLESLVDLDVAFERGRLAAEAGRARLLDENTWNDLIAAEFATLSWWRRLWIGSLRESLCRAVQTRATQAWIATLDSQVDGYRLIQNRLRRLLAQHDVERMETLGWPVDPNCMTVVEVADDPSLPPGIVLAELRPGYQWGGHVLRYAEVRAVRSQETNDEDDEDEV